jgi:hypothetical protein
MTTKPTRSNEQPVRRIVTVSTVILLLLLIAMAAADPGGLFTVTSFPSLTPLPNPSLLVLLPALYCGAVWLVVDCEPPGGSRFGLALKIWLAAIPVTVLAWFINSIFEVYWSTIGLEYVIGFASTAAFLLWSSGYAALKLALIGWLPALAAFLWRPNATGDTSTATGTYLAKWLIGGLGMLLLALLAPWLGAHWWYGGPMAYIYGEVPGIASPVPGGTVSGAAMAILIYGLATGLYCKRIALRTYREAVSVGMLSGVVATLALLAFQILLMLLSRSLSKTDTDCWSILQSLVMASEAGSFALIAVGCNIAAAMLTRCWLVSVTKSNRNPNFVARVGMAAGIGATIVLICVSVLSLGPSLPAHGTLAERKVPDTALTVRHDGHVNLLVDGRNAQVTLRGVNVNQLGEYYQADPRLAAVQLLTQQDFVDMATLGINSVRLTLSWSKLEPVRGQISEQYLDQIGHALEWAAQSRILVVLDMHQDAWGPSVVAPAGTDCRAGSDPMTGWDGAPGWATLTDGTPACQFTGRDLAPNVSRGFQSFYIDRSGIQTELVHCWAVLAKRFGSNSTVAGYDLLNEPNFAENPPVSSTLLLTNYYARSIAAIRHSESENPRGFAHPIIIEPSIFWSGFGIDNLPPAGVLHDPQLIFAPHLYNESITSDQALGINLVSIERGFRLARRAANQMGAALWIGEWGWFGDSRQQAGLWQRQAAQEDNNQIGSALWVWKQGCGDPHVYPGPVAGNIVRADCPGNVPTGIDQQAKLILQRPYLRVAPGRIDHFEKSQGILRFSGRADKWPSCDLELWIPGAQQPQLVGAEGIADLHWQRIEAGSSVLGDSGGWILHGCVTAQQYSAILHN